MNGLGQGHGGSKSRANLRSPLPHAGGEDSKLYKKKYEEVKELLKRQKRLSEQLEERVKELEMRVGQCEDYMSRQDRQLQKKQQINEVLLQRIKCLKNALSEGQGKKSGDDTSYEDKNYVKSNKSSTSNDDLSQKNQPMVGGYFGSIFK